jgi:hypothetical protein
MQLNGPKGKAMIVLWIVMITGLPKIGCFWAVSQGR